MVSKGNAVRAGVCTMFAREVVSARSRGSPRRTALLPGLLPKVSLSSGTSPACGPDQTIMDIAGRASRQMLARYSHIRRDAKRKALEAIVSKPVLVIENRVPTP